MFSKIRTLLFRQQEEKFNALYFCIGVLIIALAGLKLIRNFNNLVDISFDDEVQYMRYGIDLFHNIRNDWGPVYNLWYKFLSLFEQRPIELYLLNYKLIIILLSISLFSFLYVYGISFIISFWVGLCILISSTNILTYPRISHIVVILFLWTLIINKLFIQSKARQYILIAFAIFVGGFARPELMLSFLLFSIFTLYYIIKHDSIKKQILFALPFLAIMGWLYFFFGLPADAYKGIDRAYIAFCQHYTIKHILFTKGNFNLFIDWIAFSKEQFPDCNSFIDIVKHYPLVVIKGMFVNLGFYVLLILTAIFDTIYPFHIFPSIEILKYAIWAIVLLGIILTFILKKFRTKFIETIKNDYELILLLLVLMLPSIISSLVFFPRMHYAIFWLPILGFLIAKIIENYLGHSLKFWLLIPIITIFFFKMPSIKKYNTPMMVTNDKCPNQSYKTFIRDLNKHSDKPHVIFSNVLNLSMMTDKNFKDFGAEYDYDNNKTFIEQMNEHNVDFILQTKFLKEDRRLSKDSTWINFIENPAQYGFKKEQVFDGCNTFLLYKE